MFVNMCVYFAMKWSFLELCELKVFDSLKLPAQADRTDKTTHRDFKISANVFAPKAPVFIIFVTLSLGEDGKGGQTCDHFTNSGGHRHRHQHRPHSGTGTSV